MFGLIKKKKVIKMLATEIAGLQKNADYWYYIRKDQEYSSWLLEQVMPLKKLATDLGVCKTVYEEAYKVYDFRNSGKYGYRPNYTKLSK